MHSKTIEMVIFIYMLSVFCIPSSLGIYKKSANPNGTVTVAKWDVSLNQTGISGNVEVTEGDATGSTYTLKVVSESEVDVTYDIIVRNIPSGVQVKLGNGSFQPQSSTVTFSNVGIIPYASSPTEVTHTLTFKANSGATLVNNQQVTVDVDFKQAT